MHTFMITVIFLYVFFRSNLLGTQFTLFDHGDNPKKSGPQAARQELVAMAYVSAYLLIILISACILGLLVFFTMG